MVFYYYLSYFLNPLTLFDKRTPTIIINVVKNKYAVIKINQVLFRQPTNNVTGWKINPLNGTSPIMDVHFPTVPFLA